MNVNNPLDVGINPDFRKALECHKKEMDKLNQQQQGMFDAMGAYIPSHLIEQATVRNTADEARERLFAQQKEQSRQRQVVKEFREAYIKVRTENIVLDHQTAIELVKMINSEADTLTYEDTQ